MDHHDAMETTSQKPTERERRRIEPNKSSAFAVQAPPSALRPSAFCLRSPDSGLQPAVLGRSNVKVTMCHSCLAGGMEVAVV